MKFIKTFEIPIYETLISNTIEIDNMIRFVLDEQKKNNPEGVHKSNSGGYQTDFLEHKDIMNKFISFISPHIDDLSKQIGLKEGYQVDLNGLWINENGIGHSNIPHTHPRCNFSGVYYSEVPANSGKLCILNPLTEAVMEQGHRFSSSSVYDGEHHFTPCKGYLVIFPAWLWHYVQENRGNDKRVSVAFNLAINNYVA